MKKVLLIIFIVVAVVATAVFTVAFYSAIHEYAFPKWYDNAKIIAIDYAKSNEHFVSEHGQDFEPKAIGYKYDRRESLNYVILQVEDTYYHIYIEESKGAYIIAGFEKVDPPEWVD